MVFSNFAYYPYTSIYSIRSFIDSLAGMLSIFASIGVIIVVRQILKHNSEQMQPTCNHPMANELLVRCQELEQQLAIRDGQYEDLRAASAASHAKYLQLERHYISNEKRYHRQTVALQHANTGLVSQFEQFQRRRKELRLLPLTLFAERLLLANQMWQQKKAMHETRTQLVLREKQLNQSAFEGFTDRLVLSNVIWRQQKNTEMLKEEMEKMKKGRIKAITGAAKRMVIDTRREGMVGELVKDLTREVEMEKRKLVEMQEQHAKEVQDITSDWESKYRVLLREVERLRLGQKARLIEQEITNDMEDRLCSRLRELEANRH